VRLTFEELLQNGREYVNSLLGQDVALGDLLDLSKVEQGAGNQFSAKEIHYFNWLRSGIEGWENSNLSQLSARGHYWENENQFDGGDGFIVDGFYNVIHDLAKNLMKSNRIVLGNIVKRINYSDTEVLVECENGNTFQGDYCISSFPLGVLKSNVVQFNPPLPKWKTAAINRIGFGLMNKIVLEFNEPFWNIESSGIGFVSNTHGEFSFFLNLFPLTGRPILMCFVAADFAHDIEKLPDDDIVTSIMYTLTKIYGKIRKIPNPVKFKVTRWGQDPFARGSYSFMSFGSSHRDIEKLMYPVGRLHFAGEATFKPLGFAHGGYLSGKREAQRILNTLRLQEEKRQQNQFSQNQANQNVEDHSTDQDKQTQSQSQSQTQRQNEMAQHVVIRQQIRQMQHLQQRMMLAAKF